MDTTAPIEHGPGARSLAALFVAAWCLLVLAAPASFHSRPPMGGALSDGRIEYAVAEQILSVGNVALPEEYRTRVPRRVRRGDDGRLYSVFGIGSSLAFLPSILLDRLLLRVPGLANDWSPGEPFLAAIVHNAGFTALAVVALYLLLRELRCRHPAALAASLGYGLGTMALPYARLSFDMPMAVAALLLATWLGLRACRTRRFPECVGAGVAMGVACLVRPPSVFFLLPAIVFVSLHVRRGGLPAREAAAGGLAFAGALLPFGLAVLAFNALRFGGPFQTGYTPLVRAATFDANPLATIPTLLLSPGRGLFVFSPLVVLGLFGWRDWIRRQSGAAALVAGLILTNLLLYGANSAWATPHAWGPRFQLLVVALLCIPIGLWLDAGREGTRRWWLWLALFTVSFGVQVAACLEPHVMGFSEQRSLWDPRRSQLAWALPSALRRIAGSGTPVDSWWVRSSGSAAMLSVLAMVVASGVVAASVLLRGLVRRQEIR